MFDHMATNLPGSKGTKQSYAETHFGLEPKVHFIERLKEHLRLNQAAMGVRITEGGVTEPQQYLAKQLN
jgi:hypothetical protein